MPGKQVIGIFADFRREGTYLIISTLCENDFTKKLNVFVNKRM